MTAAATGTSRLLSRAVNTSSMIGSMIRAMAPVETATSTMQAIARRMRPRCRRM